MLSRDSLLGIARGPLYAPALAAALPFAVNEAAEGRFEALLGLGAALASSGPLKMAEGMHFSVVCAEDLPRLPSSSDRPGADFGDMAVRLYQQVCAGWPRGGLPPWQRPPPCRGPGLPRRGPPGPVRHRRLRWP